MRFDHMGWEDTIPALEWKQLVNKRLALFPSPFLTIPYFHYLQSLRRRQTSLRVHTDGILGQAILCHKVTGLSED